MIQRVVPAAETIAQSLSAADKWIADEYISVLAELLARIRLRLAEGIQ